MDSATRERDGATAAADGDGRGAPPAARGAFTLRALLLASVLTAGLAWLVPWNDFSLGNTFLYNNFLPPVVSLALLLLALGLNPLLGRRRLSRGELAVVAVALLSLGGVVSSGMTRYLETVMVGTTRTFARTPALGVLRQPLDEAERAALREELVALTAAEMRLDDRDGDGLLSRDESGGSEGRFERMDADADGRIDAEEMAAYRLQYEPGLIPDHRWPVPEGLFVGFPHDRPIDGADAEHRHVVDGYLDSLPDEPPAVRHRARVTWRDADGTVRERQLALSGRSRDRALLAGEDILDLDLGVGRQLLGAAPRTTLTLEGGGSVAVLAVDAPGTPWYAWLGPALTWAPLVFGALLAIVALAGLVRRQWIENERLPYPISSVFLTLIEDPAPGTRVAPLFRQRPFWIAFAVVAAVLSWKGLHQYGIVPIDVRLELDLNPAFSGRPWNLIPVWYDFWRWRIYFSIVAIIFFLSLDVSFSLWFFFVFANLLAMVLNITGVPMTGRHIGDASAGGFATMVALILWSGRSHYWGALRAAVGLGAGEQARSAVPYVWGLFAGTACMLAFFLGVGSPLGPSLVLVLLFLGIMLVFARIVAEAGVPFLLMPGSSYVTPMLFTLVGFSWPVAGMLPLVLIGTTFGADQREALMPFAVNAGHVGHRARLPGRRLHLAILAAALVGAVLAGASMIWNHYDSPGSYATGYSFSQMVGDRGYGHVAEGVRTLQSDAGAAAQAALRGERWLSYGAGAVLVALLGVTRFTWAASPLHPIGFLTMASWATQMIWFCMFLGWLAKFLVMRYGGSALYVRLKPVAIGMIAGEAVAMGAFMVAKIVAHLLGSDLPPVNFLPG